MKRRLFGIGLILAVMLALFLSVKATELIQTYHGKDTATSTVDNTAFLMTDTGNGDWYFLQGSYMKLRYRVRSDTVLYTTKDSVKLLLSFTPTKSPDSVSVYTRTEVVVAAPETLWTYGNKIMCIDSANFYNLLNIKVIGVDSIHDSTGEQGNVYHKLTEYWIEVYK